MNATRASASVASVAATCERVGIVDPGRRRAFLSAWPCGHNRGGAPGAQHDGHGNRPHRSFPWTKRRVVRLTGRDPGNGGAVLGTNTEASRMAGGRARADVWLLHGPIARFGIGRWR